MKIKIFMIMMVFLLMISVVYAGVTMPFPTIFNLAKGESDKFRFSIQAIANPQTVKCNYEFTEPFGLPVKWSEEEVIVEGGTSKYVYGVITVPKDAKEGSYNGEFCVRCSPYPISEGNIVNIATCGLSITVNVLGENKEIISGQMINKKIEQTKSTALVRNFLIISIVLGIILILIIIYKRKKEEKGLIDHYF